MIPPNRKTMKASNRNREVTSGWCLGTNSLVWNRLTVLSLHFKPLWSGGCALWCQRRRKMWSDQLVLSRLWRGLGGGTRLKGKVWQVAGDRYRRGNDSLELTQQREWKGGRSMRPPIWNGWEGAFRQKDSRAQREFSRRKRTSMPKPPQDGLWAAVEGTKAVLEKRSFKGRGQNSGVQKWSWCTLGVMGTASWRRQNLTEF